MYGISWADFNGLQVAARPAARARRRHHAHVDGRPVLRRRALRGRQRPRRRHAPVVVAHVRLERTPPDLGNRADHWVERPAVSACQETPPYMEAWLSDQRREEYRQHVVRMRGLLGDRMPRFACCHRRLGSTDTRTQSPGSSRPGCSERLVEPAGRRPRRTARAADRVSPGVRAVVGPLAWGTGGRDRRGAPARGSGCKGGSRERWRPRGPVAGLRRTGGPRRPRRGCWLCAPTACWAARRATGGSSRFSAASSAGSIRGSVSMQRRSRPADRPWMDDRLSLSFASEPLEEPFEILGFPKARLVVSADRPAALVSALRRVAPDGTSTLVTRGVMNLAHRDSHLEPSPLDPAFVKVAVRLNAAAHPVPAGHRLQGQISPAYLAVALAVARARDAHCDLRGQLAGAAGAGAARPRTKACRRSAARAAAQLPVGEREPGSATRRVERDFVTGEAVLTYEFGGGRRVLPSGVELADWTETFIIRRAIRCRRVCAARRWAWPARR